MSRAYRNVKHRFGALRLPPIIATGIVALFLLAVIIAPGFDAQEIPRANADLWVWRDGQYGKYNTKTGELESVYEDSELSGIAQATPGSLPVKMYETGAKLSEIRENDAQGEDRELAVPEGAQKFVQSNGHYIALTNRGEIFVANASVAGGKENIAGVENWQRVRQEAREPDLLAVAPDGAALAYSSVTGDLLRFHTNTPSGARLEHIEPGYQQIALVDGKWVAFASGKIHQQGRNAQQLETVGSAVLQESGASLSGAILIADEAGLLSVTDTVERLARAQGTPAAPRVTSSGPLASWLGPESGQMWVSGTLKHLVYDASITSLATVEPVIVTDGAEAIISETHTGMMWKVPDGQLVPLSQWSEESQNLVNETSQSEHENTEPVAPVPLDDVFGVRAGSVAKLPVLLNDYDENSRDSLSIVPESLHGLNEDFGEVSVLVNRGILSLRVRAADQLRESTARFSYRITDGTFVSEEATVTVRVVPEEVNTAPVWCGVSQCRKEWYSFSMNPGGSTKAHILDGWVDPEGDPIAIDSIKVNGDADLHFAYAANGDFSLKHLGAHEGSYGLQIGVTDNRGALTQKEAYLEINDRNVLHFGNIALHTSVGEQFNIDPLATVSGGSGEYELVQWQSAGARFVQENEKLSLRDAQLGKYSLDIRVRDRVSGAETGGLIRVTVAEPVVESVPEPLTAFVYPLSETSVDMLSVFPAGERANLAVRSIEVHPVSGAEIQADIVRYEQLRLSGKSSRENSYLGSVDVFVQDLGTEQRVIPISVFERVETGEQTPVAQNDYRKVRAGSITDIAVLENDRAPAGRELVLDSVIQGNRAEEALAFASGNTLRYLAPQDSGAYELEYSTYTIDEPDNRDTGKVIIEVVAAGYNQPPQPPLLQAKLAAGQSVRVPVPLSGIDPDGDRVKLVGVQPSENSGQLTVEFGQDIIVGALEGAAEGLYSLEYTVRDDFGAEARGQLRVLVIAGGSGPQNPVTQTDTIRTLVNGAPVRVRPLENDIDPAGGELELVNIVPHTAEGAVALGAETATGEPPAAPSSEQYRKLSQLVQLNPDNTVTVLPNPTLGTFVYRYTVRSKRTSSTSDGLLVVHTSTRAARTAPAIEDTVLNVADRDTLNDTGVDVVTGKVRWLSGDASTLQLSLWEGNKQVQGATETQRTRNQYTLIPPNRIRGTYDNEGEIVPFRLANEEIESYGFLIIPALDELRIGLKRNAPQVKVLEGESVTVSLYDLLTVSTSDTLEFAQHIGAVSRAYSQCSLEGSELRYTAGFNQPWSDVCVIQVRVSGQKRYTEVRIPIRIQPKEPFASLRSLTKTALPGENLTVDVTEMLVWQGERTGDLARLSFSLAQLEPQTADTIRAATIEGNELRLTVDARALAGTLYPLPIILNGQQALQKEPTPLFIRIGRTPDNEPRGATAHLRCTVGEHCEQKVIGLEGEFDPFAGKPGAGLELISVDSSLCQRLGSFVINGQSLVFHWREHDVIGGKCTAQFTVSDAQQRIGGGRIELDAQGIPGAPLALRQIAYGPDSLTLAITPSPTEAYPNVERMTVREDTGRSFRCESFTMCKIDGLVSGEKHTYTAYAVNAVGSSQPSPETLAWAYSPPQTPTLTAQQIGATEESGQVRIDFGAEAEKRSKAVYTLVGAGIHEGIETGSSKTVNLPFGVQHLVVDVNEAGARPPGEGEEAQSQSVTLKVTGLAEITCAQAEYTASENVSVRLCGQSEETITGYGYRAGGECRVQEGPEFTVTGVRAVIPCVQNRWGVRFGTEVEARIRAPQKLEYALLPWTSANGYRYTPVRYTVEAPLPGAYLQWKLDDGSWQQAVTIDGTREVHTIAVRQCFDASRCSEAALRQITTPARIQIPTTLIRDIEELRTYIAEPYRQSVKIEEDENGNFRLRWPVEGIELTIQKE